MNKVFNETMFIQSERKYIILLVCYFNECEKREENTKCIVCIMYDEKKIYRNYRVYYNDQIRQ